MAEIKIPKTIEGLEVLAAKVLNEKTSKPILSALADRRRWRDVKNEYDELRKNMKGCEAIRVLSKKYHYSEKTIESIIYRR